MADLPRNISLVSYKNKKDGSKQLKYRVRLQVDGENINRLFDELPDAKAFLLEARSIYGRKALSEQERAEKKALEEYRQPDFEWFLDVYFEYKYPDPSKDPENPPSALKLKRFRTYESFFRTIKNTTVETANERLLRETPHAAQILNDVGLGATISKRRKLGKFKLHEITFKHLNSYIKTRKEAGKRLSTIRKEISIISCFYRRVKHLPAIASAWTENIGNPALDIDQTLLDEKDFKVKKRPLVKSVSDDNFAKIKKCIDAEDSDFGHALLLQYHGAFRMSEAIYLTWENIDFEEKRITLPETKTGSREVSMTKELEDLLDEIEPDRSKRVGLVLKTQTYYKYQKQIQRFRKKYGFELVTHTLRKDAIGRMINRVGSENSILLAEMLGFTNVRNFETNYLEKRPDLSTVEGVMRSIGHTENSKNITKNIYYSLPKFKGN